MVEQEEMNSSMKLNAEVFDFDNDQFVLPDHHEISSESSENVNVCSQRMRKKGQNLNRITVLKSETAQNQIQKK